MPDLTADYLAMRREVGAVWLPRDFVRVTGPEAESFLQGQLSQDLAGMEPGTARLSFLLQPQGKVDALVRVTWMSDDELVLDVDSGWGEAVVARLERFKLRTKADIERVEWRCLALRGPRAHEMAEGHPRLVNDWPGLPGVDQVGPERVVRVPAGVRVCDIQAYEAVRIEAGVPVMGRELDEKTIPAETGIVERTVSFTKGCFTGQELVARIDSRGGNVPRHLRGLVVLENVLPPVGARVVVDGKEVGGLTSVAESLDRRAPVALAYVGRTVEPPTDATVSWEGGSATGRIEKLSLVS